MTSIAENELDALRGSVTGQVITAGHREYDSAREVWNGQIDHYPEVIVRCSGPRDVATALAFAQQNELEVSVRGGGHNFGGAAISHGGLVVDLSALRQVTVDPQQRTVRCGGGATFADLDAGTNHHGLAVPGGTISHTGVGGLTLGGGFGWLTSQHGLTCDNLLSVELVTVSGEILRVTPDEHPDLFWALRGGGGNFGVVTEFEYRAHPVPAQLPFGLFFWPLEQGTAALRLCREVEANLPDRISMLIAGLSAPPEPFVPEQHHLAPGCALMLAGFDAPDEHARLARWIRDALPPLFDFTVEMPYTALQRVLDPTAPWGCLGYEKALYLEGLTDPVIDVITRYMPDRASPMTFMPTFPLGGAFRDIDEDATAFGGSRDAGLLLNAVAIATDHDVLAAERHWARELCEKLTPHAVGSGAYVNFMHDYGDPARIRAAYGEAKYQRLARIKTAVDPRNVLHLNPNIRPE
jgi:FAD/FMN-containing dehydrogenase